MTDKTDMIYDQVKTLGDKMDKLIECNTKIKVGQENHEQRIRINEAVVLKHIENKEKHFNPYHNEGNWEKVKRKRVEIGTSVSLATLVSAIILKLLETIQ